MGKCCQNRPKKIQSSSMNLSREYCKYKIVGVLFIEFRLGGGANILLDIFFKLHRCQERLVRYKRFQHT